MQLALSGESQNKLAASKGDSTALDMLQSLKKQCKKREQALGDPVDVHFITFDGEEKRLRAFIGENLMDVAKRHDLVSTVNFDRFA